jgi:hypothetical protein
MSGGDRAALVTESALAQIVSHQKETARQVDINSKRLEKTSRQVEELLAQQKGVLAALRKLAM